jgi:hypothetical protein
MGLGNDCPSQGIDLNYNLSSSDKDLKNISDCIWVELDINKSRNSDKKKKFLNILFYNLYIASGKLCSVKYHADKNYYSKANLKNRKIPEIFTFHTVVPIINTLIKKEYLIRTGGYNLFKSGGKRAAQSIIYPTDKLKVLFGNCKKCKITDKDKKYEPIIIRRKTKYNDINFKDKDCIGTFQENGNEYAYFKVKTNPMTARIKKNLEVINNCRMGNQLCLQNVHKNLLINQAEILLSHSQLTLDEILYGDSNCHKLIEIKPTKLHRVFNHKNLDKGGRFYGGFEMMINKHARKYLTINGNKTVTLDYSALHISMCYHQKGLPVNDDPYTACNSKNGWRAIYKILINTMFNAKDEKSTRAGFRHTCRKKKLLNDLKLKNTWLTNENIDDLMLQVKKVHSQISDQFCSLKGMELQCIDSKIAEDIMLHFAKKNVMVLCLHDGFSVDEENEEELLDVMKKIYKNNFGFEPQIKTE